MWDAHDDYWNEYHKQTNVISYEEKMKQKESEKEQIKIRRLKNILESRKKYTPDFVTLKLGATLFPVFITGDEQHGLTHGDMLNSSEFYGTGYSVDETFILLKNQGVGQGAVAFEVSRELTEEMKWYPNSGRGLRGEVFGVSLDKLCDLDKKNMNTSASKRTTVMVKFRDSRGATSFQRCFTYLGYPSYWRLRPQFGSGSLQLADSQSLSQPPYYRRDSFYFYK